MRTSKLTMFLFFSLFASVASADDMSSLLDTTPTERAESQTRFMKTKLKLSQNVLIKVQAINQNYAEKIEPVLKGSDIYFIKMYNIKAIQQEKDDTLRGVLTPEQFAIYTNAKDELEKAMQQDLKR